MGATEWLVLRVRCRSSFEKAMARFAMSTGLWALLAWAVQSVADPALGHPLAAVASGNRYPVDPERLHGIIDTIGGFVETSVQGQGAPQSTVLRFDGMGVVAVRGTHVIAAAVYRAPTYDVLQGELVRIVKAFEARHARVLETWEGATRVVEHAADQLSQLLAAPSAFST